MEGDTIVEFKRDLDHGKKFDLMNEILLAWSSPIGRAANVESLCEILLNQMKCKATEGMCSFICVEIEFYYGNKIFIFHIPENLRDEFGI